MRALSLRRSGVRRWSSRFQVTTATLVHTLDASVEAGAVCKLWSATTKSARQCCVSISDLYSLLESAPGCSPCNAVSLDVAVAFRGSDSARHHVARRGTGRRVMGPMLTCLLAGDAAMLPATVALEGAGLDDALSHDSALDSEPLPPRCMRCLRAHCLPSQTRTRL
jgi:hypothetical protein